MLLTKEQISEQMCKHAQKKNGLHDLMEFNTREFSIFSVLKTPYLSIFEIYVDGFIIHSVNPLFMYTP